MDFDFENNVYLGHATEIDPDLILEEGLRINKDIYNKQLLSSTTLEIIESDLENGEEGLLKEFSIGTSDFRKYLIIISYEKNDYEIIKNMKKDWIDPRFICGYYDEYEEFYPSENYENFKDILFNYNNKSL